MFLHTRKVSADVGVKFVDDFAYTKLYINSQTLEVCRLFCLHQIINSQTLVRAMIVRQHSVVPSLSCSIWFPTVALLKADFPDSHNISFAKTDKRIDFPCMSLLDLFFVFSILEFASIPLLSNALVGTLFIVQENKIFCHCSQMPFNNGQQKRLMIEADCTLMFERTCAPLSYEAVIRWF